MSDAARSCFRACPTSTETPNALNLRCDVTQGLPFQNNEVDGVYSEHFIEHLSQTDGIGFLRECRRILKPGGTIRIATPDLEVSARNYITNQWRQP